MPLARSYNFVDGTVIYAEEIDTEFNALYNLLNGTDANTAVKLGAATSLNPSDTVEPFFEKLTVHGQVAFGLSSSGRVASIWKIGESNPRIDVLNTGQIRVVASQVGVDAASVNLVLSGLYHSSNAIVGNVGTGEDDLRSVSIAAYTMKQGAHVMHVKGGGTTAANGNNKRFRFYVKTTAVIDSGVITPNNKVWDFDILIFGNSGVAEWLVVGVFKCDTTEVRVNTVVTGVDHDVANTIKWTAEAVADNDIVQNYSFIHKGIGLN